MRTIFRLAVASLLSVQAFVAHAQPAERPPGVTIGDAVVSGFSGVVSLAGPRLPANAAASDRAFINPDGASARVIGLGGPGHVFDGRLLQARKTFDVFARDVGQVFGVALDDQSPPNIYLSATSAFGLNIVARGRDGQPERRKAGGPGVGWMRGQFGLDLQGDPGSIYRVDGRTGAVTLFARVQLDGVPNPGPALGNLAYDAARRQLFVSDLYTGMIHRFAIADGNESGAAYDHGVAGRSAAGQPAIAFSPANRPNIANARFNAENPDTWGFAPPERRVWALAVRGERLFYSARNGASAEAPQIWSVGLAPDGGFASDARLELEVVAQPGPYAVSDIAFSNNGAMILAQRAPIAASYDYSAFTRPGQPRVLRYATKEPNDQPSPGLWKPTPDEYSVGFAEPYRNANGGVALSYGYGPDGRLSANACEATLWATGQSLRNNPALRSQLEPGGPLRVGGLQSVPATALNRPGEPPMNSAFVDYDDALDDDRDSGHIGSVRILTQPCPATANVAGGAPAASSSPPYADGPTTTPPPDTCVGPNCLPCRFGANFDGTCREPIDLAIKKTAGEVKFDEKALTWTVQFTLVVTNTGNPFAPGSSIGVNDPVPTGMTFVSASGAGWTCTAAINCTFAFGSGVFATGATLPPIVVTLTVKEPGKYENCARVGVPASSGFVETTLGNNRDCASVETKFPPNDVSVVKTGPRQCNAEDACTFTITVTNNSSWPFSGPVNFNDNAGTPMNIASTTLPCTPPPTAIPFACTGTVNLPAGPSTQSYTIVGVIPAGSLVADSSDDIYSFSNCITAESPPPVPGFPVSTIIKNVKACNEYQACGFMCHMVQPQIDQIKIEKTANSAECSPGGLCSFTFTVTNLSTTVPTTVFPISFIDTMPAGATTFVPPPAPPPWSCLPFGGSPDQIKCLHPPGSIPAGGSLSVTVTFQISPTYKENSLENCSAFFIGNMPSGGQPRRAAASKTDETKLRAYLESRGIQTLRASPPPVLGEDDKSCATVKIAQTDKPRIVPPPPPPVCTPPMVPGAVPGQCVCPQGTVQQGRECVKSPPPVCTPPMISGAIPGQCICPQGTVQQGRECVKSPPPPPVCAPPQVPGPVAGTCVCPQGTVARGRECVPTLVCRSPKIPNGAGTACVCPDGLVAKGRACIQPVVCNPPAKLNRRGICACPPDMVARGRSCVPRERERERPSITPGDIIRIIPNGRDNDRDRVREPRGGQDRPDGARGGR